MLGHVSVLLANIREVLLPLCLEHTVLRRFAVQKCDDFQKEDLKCLDKEKARIYHPRAPFS
jgi:hypothetical protein